LFVFAITHLSEKLADLLALSQKQKYLSGVLSLLPLKDFISTSLQLLLT
jgi:hypothetical protein